MGSVEWNILCSPQNAAFLKKDCILCITMYNATFAIEIKRAHLLKIWKWCILNIHHFHILRWTSMSRACFVGAERFGKFQTQICRISHRTKAPTGQTNSDNEQGTLPGTHIYPCFLNMDIGHRRHRYLGKIYVSDLILIFRTPPHFSIFFHVSFQVAEASSPLRRSGGARESRAPLPWPAFFWAAMASSVET